MENVNSSELVFVLDKSGSMSGLEADTIGGFNSMLAKQKEQQGTCRVTTVLFDNNYKLLHDRIDLAAVSPLTANDYLPGGSTALLDALGDTIHKIIDVQKSQSAEHRAEKVIFVIITDGQENSSRRFSAPEIKSLITSQQSEFGWEFIFLGANIDAVSTAARYGISEDRASRYVNDSKGVNLNFACVGEALSFMRSKKGRMTREWKQRIDEDYMSREGSL